MASTTVGGGVFWGDWVNEGDVIDEGAEEREENEEHKMIIKSMIDFFILFFFNVVIHLQHNQNLDDY